MSERFKVTLAYDGTNFHGSQRQKELRTVQGEVEKALREIDWQGSSVYFAGRTDAGVHAAGQVIAFDKAWTHGSRVLQRAMNASLPGDIAAVNVERTRSDFQPRYDALYRRYKYQIRCSPTRDPLQDRYIWRTWPEVDLDRMQEACSALIGVHDFRALGSPHQEDGSTVRRVSRAAWDMDEDRYTFWITGNAFLYHMVRHIVISLVEIGQGRKPVHAIQGYLDHPDGSPAKGLAPPQGLILSEVGYPED